MENGGGAFPLEHSMSCRGCHDGMSLRDYFACHIAESLIKSGGTFGSADAEKAYQAATTLLAARIKEYTPTP